MENLATIKNMIAAAGYYRFAHGHTDGLEIDALPTWPLTEL